MILLPFLEYKRNPEQFKSESYLDFIFYDEIIDILHNEFHDRSGYIYILDNHINNFYKVGMTRKSVSERIKSLNSAGVFHHLSILSYYPVKDVFLEYVIHNDMLSIGGMHIRHKEFFDLPLNLIENIILENIKIFDEFLCKFHDYLN